MAKDKDSNIYRNGKYYHVAVVADGVRYKRTSRSASIKDARALLARLTARANAGLPLDDKPAKPFDPLLDVLKAHIRRTEADKNKKVTAVERQRVSLAHIQKHLGNPRVDTLGRDKIEGYIKARFREGATGGTVQKEVGFLKAALNRALRDGKAIPPMLTQRHEVPGAHKKRNRLLTKAEIGRLREELAKGAILDHFLVALYTGLRKGELRGLEMRQVDFQAGTMNIPDTKTGNPKVVTMHRVVKEIMFQRRSDDPLAKPFHAPVNLLRTFKEAAARAGVYNVCWHDLRRAMASYMFMSGADLSTVMKQGGWKTSAVLLEVYAQVTTEHVKQQVGLLDFEGEPEAGTNLGQNSTPERRAIAIPQA